VIRLYDMNRRLADIEKIDGVMRVVSYDGDWVERSWGDGADVWQRGLI